MSYHKQDRGVRSCNRSEESGPESPAKQLPWFYTRLFSQITPALFNTISRSCGSKKENTGFLLNHREREKWERSEGEVRDGSERWKVGGALHNSHSMVISYVQAWVYGIYGLQEWADSTLFYELASAYSYAIVRLQQVNWTLIDWFAEQRQRQRQQHKDNRATTKSNKETTTK